MESDWKFVGSSLDGEAFTIEGVNVWERRWVPAGLGRVEVTDPHYGRAFRFEVYDIEGTGVRFAAGEFSNCVWGFYVPAPAGAGVEGPGD